MFWRKKKKSAAQNRDEIIAKAKAVAAAKTQEIGEDTLSEIRNALLAKENAPMAQAKAKIMQMDQDKLNDHLKYWMQDK